MEVLSVFRVKSYVTTESKSMRYYYHDTITHFSLTYSLSKTWNSCWLHYCSEKKFHIGIPFLQMPVIEYALNQGNKHQSFLNWILFGFISLAVAVAVAVSLCPTNMQQNWKSVRTWKWNRFPDLSIMILWKCKNIWMSHGAAWTLITKTDN